MTTDKHLLPINTYKLFARELNHDLRIFGTIVDSEGSLYVARDDVRIFD